MMPDLKPCPFCGGEALLMLQNNGCWNVECNTCLARTKAYMPKNVNPWEAYDAIQTAVNKAVDDWNRRANDENQ